MPASRCRACRGCCPPRCRRERRWTVSAGRSSPAPVLAPNDYRRAMPQRIPRSSEHPRHPGIKYSKEKSCGDDNQQRIIARCSGLPHDIPADKVGTVYDFDLFRSSAARQRPMDHRTQSASKRRGRPSKFGRPSRVVALTLPEDVIDQLRPVHNDLGWAIGKLLDQSPRAAGPRGDETQPDVELVTIAERRGLILVNPEAIRNLPGVNIMPLGGTRAYLALYIDRAMRNI